MQLQENAARKLSSLSYWNLLISLVASSLIPILTFVINLPSLHSRLIRLGAFALGVLIGTIFLRAFSISRKNSCQLNWTTCLAAVLVFSSSLYLVLSYVPEITNYPFTLTWSEASRYYYASLYFSKRIYDFKVPPTVLHPSRYLLQAVPFLLPNSPIWLHRAWQALLWIAAPIAASLLLARRLQISSSLERWLFIATAYLIWMVGPVYYHLLVPVIIVLGGFRTFPTNSQTKRFVISVLAIILASAWAGISRVNWYPVPGSMAAALILMEEPIPSGSKSGTWAYLLKLTGWVIFGTAVAFLAQICYILWSGNSAEQFTTSFSSSLLWHRLLPNATYPPGILLAIFIVSLPMIFVIIARIIDHPAVCRAWRRYHPIRLLGLMAILIVFFAGGMVVSVKIGGGSNLHNLDAFLSFLLLISSFFNFRKVVEQPDDQNLGVGSTAILMVFLERIPPQKILRAAIAAGLVVYSASAILTHLPAGLLPDPDTTSKNLAELAAPVGKAVQKGGKVLFISNRQLLTFNYLDVPLIPDYERVFLMEAAMANATEYLDRLYQDLAAQRFELIIVEPLSRDLKRPRSNFGAENNAWVENVARHILCYYTPIKTLRSVQLQIMAPAGKMKKYCP